MGVNRIEFAFKAGSDDVFYYLVANFFRRTGSADDGDALGV
jgi:hypothetical protein